MNARWLEIMFAMVHLFNDAHAILCNAFSIAKPMIVCHFLQAPWVHVKLREHKMLKFLLKSCFEADIDL